MRSSQPSEERLASALSCLVFEIKMRIIKFQKFITPKSKFKISMKPLSISDEALLSNKYIYLFQVINKKGQLGMELAFTNIDANGT